MRTILALYLHKSLGFSEDMSTVVYHVFVMLCYFTPLLGGIIADSWLGKYRTIFYVSCIYAVGNIVLAVGSVSSLNISHKAMSLVGLFLIAAGTGGIKPCVSSFGGDQFVMPEQERQLQGFFSVFYFTINAGSVLSCFFTPMLREQVSCLGQETCDPLAFGVPAVLMVISIMFFVGGRRMYKMKDPEGNIMSLVCKCIGHAISRKISRKKGEGREHWLDYADDIYPKRLIEETKIFINLAILFSPTIVFWALYEQQGSRWTFQASHMDGNLGGYYLDPDQIQTLNPVLVLIFIPIFDKGFYPLLAKLRIIRTPLQKLSWGGLLGALAFLVSGLVELKIQPSYPVLAGSGEAHLRVYNTLQCDIGLNYMNNDGVVNQLGMLERLALPVVGNTTVQLKMTGRDYCKTYKAVETSFVLQEMEVSQF
ncbi:hypothetical protein AAG570_012071 [Ranatra chinensis]|uniref:Oligopeptide transporter 1 n=1 Tax=Ranatra chinensis TaxID=642074 RepID=A0ABD0YHQ4_9HEMI